ncbi:MAG TPA: hypothetical protein PKA05_20175 [Roseiflexaceae bacterium]|nr:hypothetical protein [Roseiflexaceae bacterium]HMP42708.1 hypothetical protein [Roseiflexaceae bacterium]
MAEFEYDPVTRQRLIESWLPLVQEANSEYGWGYTARELEEFILEYAADLGQADNVALARAIVWSRQAHFQQRR